MNNQRIVASLEQKLAQGVGHRVDLQLADARKVNKTTAHFMIAFAETAPTSDEISEFFVRQFNAKITPYISTAKVYEKEKVVTVVASLLNVTRELKDVEKKGMATVIKGSVYLDVPLQEVWEVQERQGQKVLVRKVKDDIMAIVQARRNAMMDSNFGHKTFAALAQGSNLLKYLALLEKGDHVKAYIDEKIVDAEVLAVNDQEVKIKYAGGLATVPRQAVVEISQRSAEKEKASQQLVEEYFSKAYGDPDYAKQLVRK